MRVVIDSNALFDDPVMVREAGQRVLDLLIPARAKLVFSPVVLGELDRQRRNDVEDLHAPIRGRIRKLSGLAGLDAANLLAQTQTVVDAAEDRWTSRWNEIRADDSVEIGPWPSVTPEVMVERELARKRPFQDKDAGSVGHRDTLIWLGVVELAAEDPDDEILFVTADKAFLSSTGLHPHLLADLDAVGAPHAVTWVRSLHALVAELQKATETSGWDSWREPRIAELLHEEIRNLHASEFSEHWDARDGGTAAPTFDIGLPYTGHDWNLSEADGPQDLVLEEAEFGAGELTCTFTVDLYFSGFMDKSEWYVDDHGDVDLWDADWNDHLVSLEAGRRVRIKARFEIDDHEETAFFDDLLNAEVVPNPLGTPGA